MTGWRRWVRQPQTVFLRKAAFQVHLWIGIGLGLYIVMLSLTGSFLVFRREMDEAFRTKVPAYDGKATVLTTDQIATRARSDRKSTRLNSSHVSESRMPSSA